MLIVEKWKRLGWRHSFWDLLRYYRSIRGTKQQALLLDRLITENALDAGASSLSIPGEDCELLNRYLAEADKQLRDAFRALRDEDEALRFCADAGLAVSRTRTQNRGHHQSSKSMVAAVTAIAEDVCAAAGVSLDSNPQRRCIWASHDRLHVTARNVDGAVMGLMNPFLIWEIKEYWGKTSGGSKMSDAVYECHLVGRELREFEEDADSRVSHVVFLDGKEQWNKRKSDMRRFVDLFNQGLIDHLIVGREVETDWRETLLRIMKSRTAS